MLNFILGFFLQNWKEENFDFPDGYFWGISSNLYTDINITRYFYKPELVHLVHFSLFFFIHGLYFLNEYAMGTFRYQLTCDFKDVDLNDF